MLLPDNALRTVMLALPAIDALPCSQLLREQHFSVINAGGIPVSTLLDRVRDSEPDFLVATTTTTGLGDGLALLQQVRAFSKFGTKCIAALDPTDTVTVNHAMALDISGYLALPLHPADLLTCLHCLFDGKRYVAEALTAAKSGSAVSLPDSLTDRERQVLCCMGRGSQTRQIAQLLGVSNKTVESHKYNLTRKCGLTGADDLRAFAIRLANSTK